MVNGHTEKMRFSMPNVLHHQFSVESAGLTTTLIDAAAAVEIKLHDAEARVTALQQDLQQLQHRHDQARQWLVAIRKCHRSGSHALTTHTIKAALANLESGQPLVLNLF
jgi:hypothetical protein